MGSVIDFFNVFDIDFISVPVFLQPQEVFNSLSDLCGHASSITPISTIDFVDMLLFNIR